MSNGETREQAIERANQQIVEQMHEQQEFDKKRMALPAAPAEEQRATSLRTFIREENNRLVEAFRDIIKRELLENNRELKREMQDIKKLIG